MLLGPDVAQAVRARAGHVLLEVVISVFLLGVGFVSLARLSLGASWMIRQARWRTAAGALASQKMEQLLTLGFEHQTIEEVSDPGNPLGEDGESDPGGAFHRSWAVSLVEPSLKLVVVRVRWEVPRPGNVELVSLSASRRGVVNR